MNRRQRTILLCLAILVILTLACNSEVIGVGTRRYNINTGQEWRNCDDYEWDGDDLKLYGCGYSGYNVTITNASNVVITDRDE